MKKSLKQKISRIPLARKLYIRIKGNQFINPMANYQEKLLKRMMPSDEMLERMIKESKLFTIQPLISIIMPTYNTDLQMLDEAIASVQAQVYMNWELVIVDDCSPNEVVRDRISEYAAKDTRIKTVFLFDNHHIANATNRGFQVAQGDFIALFDHDDYLYPNALYENVKAINAQPDIQFIYSDEDKIDEYGNHHFDAYLKPDFNPDFLRCMNIITHFVVFKKTLWEQLGGEDAKYNGAQDWEFVMRLTDTLSAQDIFHIDKVIYSWRVHSGSTAMETEAKPYVPEAQRNLLRQDLAQRHQIGVKVYENYEVLGQWLFQYPVLDNPLVSIVVKASTVTTHLEKLLQSIFIKTSYFNFEVVLPSTSELLVLYQAKHENVSTVINGDYVLVIDPNFEVLTFDWLEKMLGQAQREDVTYVMPRIVGQTHHIVESAGLAVSPSGEVINLLNGFNTLGQRTLIEQIHLTTHHQVTGVNPYCYMVASTLFDPDVDVVKQSIEMSLAHHHHIFVSDVQIKNNLQTPLVKSLGTYEVFKGIRDKTVNANFLAIEQEFKRSK